MNKSENRDKKESLPRRLGRYILLSRLHEGGMTEVYAARLADEVGPGRLLVIKILPQSSKDNPDAEVRFLREARIVLNLTHGNITAAFEFGREQGRPFLVMEYVPGPSLRRLLDMAEEAGCLLKVQDSLFIVREIFRAMSYAHSFSHRDSTEQGIVHRDISPDNILISTAGQVKLTDFGIAQYSHRPLQDSGWGKAAYIAPEVALGNSPTSASDIYSLGSVLYECLTGVPPLKGDNNEETLKLVMSSTPRPPSALRKDIPDELDRYILRLLSKNPEQRPSASEAEVEMRSLLAEMHFSYAEPTLAETVVKYFPNEDHINSTSYGHIREGMLRAGVALDGSETTGQLIAEGTIPLNGARGVQPEIKSSLSNPLSNRYLLLGSATLIVLSVITILGLGSRESQTPAASNKHDALEERVTSTAVSPPLIRTTAPEENHLNEVSNKKEEPPRKTDKKIRREKKSKDVIARKIDKENGRVKKIDSKETQWGWLNINSYPWSYVSVDGKSLNGHTPYRKVKLISGNHTLIFENPKLGLKVTKNVNVRSWEETNIGVRLKGEQADKP
ncbi:MAG: serine/threonine protein kinase [Proteobacteria bacterium]|nr:serine/threonine protein kinase [Pseudomonadota bacterium]